MTPCERETTDEETPTPPPPPPPPLAAPSADQPPPQPPSQTSPADGTGRSSMAARDSEPAADLKEPLSTTTTNSPHRLMSESSPPDGGRSGSSPSDRRLVSPPARSRRSPDFGRQGSSPPRELSRRRSRSPLLTEFSRRRRRSPPLTEFGRRRGSSRPLTETSWHGTHSFRELRRTPPHRGSPPLEGFRCRGSPPRMTGFRRCGSPPLTEMRRRGSPPLAEFRRHRSPLMVDARPYGRISGDQGYPIHAGLTSPPRRHRSDEARFDMELDRPAGPSRRVHGFRGGRGDGRLRDRDNLLPNGREKGVGGRGHGQSARGPAPHYELRNDPNLSPREGDWICQNPSCGNLNFGRRTHCNICNQHRHSTQLQNRSLSPRGGYVPSPPHHRSPPVRMLGPPPERTIHREPVRYHRSPPRDWALDAGPFNPRGERLVRADLLECRERGGKFGWPGDEEFTRGERGVRDGFLVERRRGRRSASPLHDRFARDLHERSRSPIGDRKLKFVRRGRGGRDFGRGGYKRSSGDSFNGRGRGDERVVSRGRNGNAY